MQLPEVPELGSDNKEMIRGLVYKADDEDVEAWSLLAQFFLVSVLVYYVLKLCFFLC